ncbi:MAG: ThuA domain-containing protein [Chthonomonadales bacterium]
MIPACACAAILAATALGAPLQPEPIRVLIVTGGHDFEREAFFDIFRAMPGVSFREVAHPASDALFKLQAARSYDVLLLYDMWPSLSQQAQGDLLRLLRQGKGVVALHHCLAGYPDWPEYQRILGGRYFQKPHTENGVTLPPSNYRHGVAFQVHVVDPKHPVTRGLKDFDIVDETYHGLAVDAEVTPLLTTSEPSSSPVIAWTHRYGASQVVTIALGHDHTAYLNPAFRTLLRQAIFYVAPKKTPNDGR